MNRTPTLPRASHTGPAGAPAALILALCVALPLLIAVSWALDDGPHLLWTGAPAIVTLAALTVFPLTRAARREGPVLGRIILLGFVAKLLGTLARYAFTFSASGADANSYNEEGARLAPFYRQFDFSPELGRKLIGTGFVRGFTGAVYAIFGTNRFVGSLVFACLAWWGLFFFYRAFRTALPDGDAKRYAKLLFFLPSLVFWPSSIGKEALMCFALGVAALGVARILVFHRGGLALFLCGVAGAALIRPHVALACFAAASGALLLRRTRPGRGADPVSRTLLMLVLLIVGGTMLSRTASFFGVEGLDSESIEQIQTETNEQTTQGGSSFTPVVVRTPLDVPLATITVLFRPFPHEADNLESFLASAETLVLLGVLAANWRRLRILPRTLARSPYVLFAIVFAGLFVFGFSSIGNFGILARQRTQALPFVLVALAIPLRRPGRGVSASSTSLPTRGTAASWRASRD